MQLKKLRPIVALPLLLASLNCNHPAINFMVYSAGFSFARYDYLVFGKPEGEQSATLYGMDVETANLMARYNMTIVGHKEFGALPAESKAKTLIVRYAVSTFNKDKNIITISFDDALSGKAVASLTSESGGDLLDTDDRARALAGLTQPLADALTREKGLKVTIPAPASPTH